MRQHVRIEFPNGSVRHFGDQSGTPIRIKFLSWWYVWRTLWNASMGFGDGYTRGKIGIGLDDLRRLLNSPAPKSRLLRLVRWVLYYRPPNLRWLQRLQIRHHYDIGNEYYRLFLDPETWSYTCARFTDPLWSLGRAQQEKINNLLLKLQLRPHQGGPRQRLLDIGCGWGHLAVAAAKQYGAEVLGITLSAEQLRFARELAKREGVDHLVTFRLTAYQDLAAAVVAGAVAPFDRIVSVGMFEHVGRGRRRQYTYFRAVNQMLATGGITVLHSIIKQSPDPLDPWVLRRIFPGGNVPTLAQLVRGFTRFGFYTVDVENLWQHYALTLQHWAAAHLGHRPEITALHGQEFFRMRQLWLEGSMAAFDHGDMGIVQIVATQGKPAPRQWPWTRDANADALTSTQP